MSYKLFYTNSSKDLNKLPVYKIIPGSCLNLLTSLWFAVSALQFQKISQASLGHTRQKQLTAKIILISYSYHKRQKLLQLTFYYYWFFYKHARTTELFFMKCHERRLGHGISEQCKVARAVALLDYGCDLHSLELVHRITSTVVQQNYTHLDAGYSDRQLSGLDWHFG